MIEVGFTTSAYTLDMFGTAIDPHGGGAIVSGTQSIPVSSIQQGWGPGRTLEIGMRDTGYLGRVRVYSIWAVAHYRSAAPTADGDGHSA